jgi:hypothetical protein
MKTLKQAREAYDVMDQWFDSPLRKRRTREHLAQIQGAHAALAWLFGKQIPGSADFDANIALLKRELPKGKERAS